MSDSGESGAISRSACGGSATCAIGVDLGGTDLKIGLVDGDLKIIDRIVKPTGKGIRPCEVIESIGVTIATLTAGGCPAVGVGIGAPGPSSTSRGVVFASPNFPGWHDVHLREEVADRVGLPVVLDNDANVAAYGEYLCGSGDDTSDMVLLTLGTGLGAGTILDGRIFHGHFDNASEWGHTIVESDGRPCQCGQRGCLEQYVSAGGMVRRAMEELEGGASSSLGDVLHSGGVLAGVDIATAAQAGDAMAVRLWNDACRYLAVACCNIQHTMNPRRILLGGGMSEAGGFLLDPVRERFAELRWKLYDDHPDIALAKLRNDAGIIGAAMLALHARDGVVRP